MVDHVANTGGCCPSFGRCSRSRSARAACKGRVGHDQSTRVETCCAAAPLAAPSVAPWPRPYAPREYARCASAERPHPPVRHGAHTGRWQRS
eukprot:4053726-Prymnesium_polylepis.1